MKAVHWKFWGCLLLLCGCSSGPLPRGAQKVGGGLSIHYEAPTDGTVILMERTTGKIIATESEGKGGRFDFGEANTPDWEGLFTMLFPAPPTNHSQLPYLLPTNALFELYFVPEKSR